MITCIKCGTQVFKTGNGRYCDNCYHEIALTAHRNNYQDHKEERLDYQKRYSRAVGRCGVKRPGVTVRLGYIKKALREILYGAEFTEIHDERNEDSYYSNYLGSYMSLDPCGKYHHILSINGASRSCEMFWDNLNKAADDLNGWIEGGEGDPTDVFFCMGKGSYERKIKNHRSYLNSKRYRIRWRNKICQ